MHKKLLWVSIITKEFTMAIKQDEDGIYIASMPGLEGCHKQAKTLDELREGIKEAIESYLEVESDLIHEMPLNFFGIQKVEVVI
jgi:predicted RNase H-like HicB family nuclease